MNMWTAQTNIDFTEDNTDSEPDVWVKFVVGRHGKDPFPFDGPGGTLAHAFYPGSNKGFDGDVHFDDDEVFTINNSNEDGRDLKWVATHELGEWKCSLLFLLFSILINIIRDVCLSCYSSRTERDDETSKVPIEAQFIE